MAAVLMSAASQLIQWSKHHTGTYEYSYYAMNTLTETTKLAIALAALFAERGRCAVHVGGGGGVCSYTAGAATALQAWQLHCELCRGACIHGTVYQR